MVYVRKVQNMHFKPATFLAGDISLLDPNNEPPMSLPRHTCYIQFKN